MNYLLVNGYKKSFELFNSLNGGEVNLKAIANHKDKVNKNEDPQNANINSSGMRFRSNSQLRKDSEGMRSRRASMVKLETQLVSDNEEVIILLNHRYSDLTRRKDLYRERTD